MRRDSVGGVSKGTLRYQSRLIQIGVGRPYAGTDILLLAADDDARVVRLGGELLWHLMIEPSHN